MDFFFFFFFLQIFFDCNAEVYVVFLRLLCTENDIKRSNKNNHLREVNAEYLHSPVNLYWTHAVHFRNKFHFSEIHGSMNATGHVQSYATYFARDPMHSYFHEP